jgi:excisionase family DNA binding protein
VDYLAANRIAAGGVMELKVLAHTINDACRVSGLGRTTLYAALKTGALSARKCGRRTLILAADLERFLDGLPTTRKGFSSDGSK